MSNTAYADKHHTITKPIVHETQYLRFRWVLASITRKTEIWSIESKSSGEALGGVHWYSPWRCYVFFPNPRTLFNAQCLQDIRDFISAEMLERSS